MLFACAACVRHYLLSFLVACIADLPEKHVSGTRKFRKRAEHGPGKRRGLKRPAAVETAWKCSCFGLGTPGLSQLELMMPKAHVRGLITATTVQPRPRKPCPRGFFAGRCLQDWYSHSAPSWQSERPSTQIPLGLLDSFR
eukprot:s826_g4.t1